MMVARSSRRQTGRTRSAAPRLRAASSSTAQPWPASPFVADAAAVLTYPLWWPYAPNDIDLLAMNNGPSATHWLGSDGVGRDVFARLLQGGRISLLVAVVLDGDLHRHRLLRRRHRGLRRPLVDAVSMRFVDLAMTLPPVIFLLVLASIAGTGIWPTILVISLLSWPVLARMVRARLLELRERDFVVAARGMGAGLPHLLFRHGLPNSHRHPRRLRDAADRQCASCSRPASPSSVSASPRRKRAGATCSTSPAPPLVLEQYPWQWMFPGAALVLTVLAINFIGDGLRDAFDPRSDLN